MFYSKELMITSIKIIIVCLNSDVYTILNVTYYNCLNVINLWVQNWILLALYQNPHFI